MSINYQEIAVLLNLCPICPDIQYKILMLFIGINGTPTSKLFKAPCIFTFYTKTGDKIKSKFTYSNTPLKPSAYFMDLVRFASLKSSSKFNLKKFIPNSSYETGYEILVAYILTCGSSKTDWIEKLLNEITKNRLNKMIATEPVIENIL